MKVVDIISSDLAFMQLGNRLKKINEAGIENSIIFPAGYSNEKFKSLGIPFVLYDKFTDFSFRPTYFFKTSKELSELISDLKPDIIHTHDSKAGTLGRVAGRKAKVPIVIHQVHGFFFRRHTGVKRKIFASIEKYLSNKCDIMLFQNREDLKEARNLNFDRKARLIFINNGIDFSDFDRLERKFSPKDEGILRLVYVARMDENKNHEMVLKALERITESIPIELHLIGDGPLFERHKKRIAETTRLANCVVFHRFVDRKGISKITNKCHINLLSSKQEGKPRTAMEAAYMGIPTIATDIEGTREVVIPGITGELVPFDDYAAMKEKVEKLYRNSDYWYKLTLSSRKYAEENFDENKVVDKLLTIYKFSYEGKWKELQDYAVCLENQR